MATKRFIPLVSIEETVDMQKIMLENQYDLKKIMRAHMDFNHLLAKSENFNVEFNRDVKKYYKQIFQNIILQDLQDANVDFAVIKALKKQAEFNTHQDYRIVLQKALKIIGELYDNELGEIIEKQTHRKVSEINEQLHSQKNEIKQLKSEINTIRRTLNKEQTIEIDKTGLRIGNWLIEKGAISYISDQEYYRGDWAKCDERIITKYDLPPDFNPNSTRILAETSTDKDCYKIKWKNWNDGERIETLYFSKDLWLNLKSIPFGKWGEKYMNLNPTTHFDKTFSIPESYQEIHKPIYDFVFNKLFNEHKDKIIPKSKETKLSNNITSVREKEKWEQGKLIEIPEDVEDGLNQIRQQIKENKEKS